MDDGTLLPGTAQLLTMGGDERILLSHESGRNKYGCIPVPDIGLCAFGSSTATSISEQGFHAAQALRDRLLRDAGPHGDRLASGTAREQRRIERELLQLCDLADTDVQVQLAPSGTDLHLMAAQSLAASCDPSPLIIMMEPCETGSGVPHALAGLHFCAQPASGVAAKVGSPIAHAADTQVATIALREADGTPRAMHGIQAEIESLVQAAHAEGRLAMVVMLDVSKTGLLAPTPAFASQLAARWPETVRIMVDACQFRLSNASLRAYLAQGFAVALTGSKFMTGPSFCGALLTPAHADARTWQAVALHTQAHPGLLMRWEAALTELRAFAALPPAHVRHFIRIFGRTVVRQLDADPAFLRLAQPSIDRGDVGSASSWDRLPTIFPFLLLTADDASQQPMPLTRGQTQRVYQLMQQRLGNAEGTDVPGMSPQLARMRAQLGQPVACGTYRGVPVSALRLCLSARLIVEATSDNGANTEAVVQRAIAVLRKAAALAHTVHQLPAEATHHV